MGGTLGYRDRIPGEDEGEGVTTDCSLPLSSVEIAGPRCVVVGCELNGAGPRGSYTKRSLAHKLPSSSFPEPVLSVRAAIPVFDFQIFVKSLSLMRAWV